jgi:hypothetical protein
MDKIDYGNKVQPISIKVMNSLTHYYLVEGEMDGNPWYYDIKQFTSIRCVRGANTFPNRNQSLTLEFHIRLVYLGLLMTLNQTTRWRLLDPDILPRCARTCNKVLDNFSKCDNNVVKTPMDISVYLSKNKGEGIKKLEHSRIIRSLMHAMNCTRPDIIYSISKLSRFLSNPTMDH